MKTNKTIFGIAASVILATSATSVSGQIYQVINLDENGDGYITPSEPFPYTVATEPISGIATLEYTLPFAGVAGDLLLEQPDSSQISDVLRFDGESDVYFFADVYSGPSQLADVGLPPSYISPNVTVIGTAIAGGYSYTYIPTSSEPGYKVAGPVAYQIITEVPEPSAMMMGGLGGLLLLLNSRRQAKRG
jgi:hypothetical protein